MPVVLRADQYGKAGIHLLHVTRGTPEDPARHEVTDVTVSTALAGDFEAVHRSGDNAAVVATDTQRNVVHALAREHGVAPVEEFALRVARHLAGEHRAVHRARAHVTEQPWQRATVDGHEHPHAFLAAGGELRTATATVTAQGEWLVAGLDGLVLLKSTGSEFTGFARDRYTTLPETTDRVLATEVTARWRYAGTEVGVWAGQRGSVRGLLVETFAAQHSLSLQQTLFAMAEAVLARCPGVVEVRLSMPNRHHLLVDLEPFGLDNPGVVFHATDRPYGLIEAAVARDDAPDAGEAWAAQPLVAGG
jgi:urate oxidase